MKKAPLINWPRQPLYTERYDQCHFLNRGARHCAQTLNWRVAGLFSFPSSPREPREAGQEFSCLYHSPWSRVLRDSSSNQRSHITKKSFKMAIVNEMANIVEIYWSIDMVKNYLWSDCIWDQIITVLLHLFFNRIKNKSVNTLEIALSANCDDFWQNVVCVSNQHEPINLNDKASSSFDSFSTTVTPNQYL